MFDRSEALGGIVETCGEALSRGDWRVVLLEERFVVERHLRIVFRRGRGDWKSDPGRVSSTLAEEKVTLRVGWESGGVLLARLSLQLFFLLETR